MVITMQNLIQKFDAATVKNINSAIATIRDNEKSTVELINSYAPVMIGGAWAGDSINCVNEMVAALKKDRKTNFINAVIKVFPNQYDKDTGKFTKRYDDKKTLAKRAAAFDDFINSGATFYEFMTEKKPKAVEKPIDWRQKLEKVVHGAVNEGGFTLDDVMAVVRLAVRAEMLAQEKAQADQQAKEHQAAIDAANEQQVKQAVRDAGEMPLADVA